MHNHGPLSIIMYVFTVYLTLCTQVIPLPLLISDCATCATFLRGSGGLAVQWLVQLETSEPRLSVDSGDRCWEKSAAWHLAMVSQHNGRRANAKFPPYKEACGLTFG